MFIYCMMCGSNVNNLLTDTKYGGCPSCLSFELSNCPIGVEALAEKLYEGYRKRVGVGLPWEAMGHGVHDEMKKEWINIARQVVEVFSPLLAASQDEVDKLQRVIREKERVDE